MIATTYLTPFPRVARLTATFVGPHTESAVLTTSSALILFAVGTIKSRIALADVGKYA